MNNVADYVLIRDGKFTITYPGTAHTFNFDTSPRICRSCPSVLFFVMDTVGKPKKLRVRFDINGETVGELRFSRNRFNTIHEIANVLLKPMDNTIEFLPLSGSGKVRISDVVLLVKVGNPD